MKNKKKKEQAYNIRKIYEQMELDLIASMRRNLSRHEKEEAKVGFKFEQWQSAKLRDLVKFRRENKKIIGEYSKEVEELINKTLMETYKESQDNVNILIKEIKNQYIEGVTVKLPGDLNSILPPIEDGPLADMAEKVLENLRIWDEAPRPIDDSFFRSNDKKFNALIETVEHDFKKANSAVLRRMDDVYRQTIFKTQVHFGQGAITLDKAIDMATEDFLAKGIDAITYKNGNKVNIASYAEMALRTANHRAYLMGEGKKRQEMGIPFVVVSAHATSCKLCVPWQGFILIDDIYSGGKKEDRPYPLLSEAMEEGFLHPNCRHNLSTYFHGITTLPKVPNADKALENYEYEYEQKQRHIERQIRKYKRLAEGSIDEDNQKKYKDKVKEWQVTQREHLKENPQLRRAYNREKTRDVPFDYGQEYDNLKDILTSDNIKIGGVSHHFKLRAVDRKISSENIENALKNPLNIGKIKYDSRSRPSKEYLGKDARVQINPETGNIVTVWRTSSKLRNKYMGDKNGKD